MPNSSPPKRATMSPGRRWARRRGATARQQIVAGVVADAVVDQLEVVEVEEEDADRRARGDAAAQRVAQRVDEAGPVGQAGQRVVQDPVAQSLVGAVALQGVGQHVRRGLDEVDVLRGEVAGLGGVDVEHAEGALLAGDRHREAAAHAEYPQRRRHREAALARPVVDDHVQARLQRGARVRVAGRRGAAFRACLPLLETGAEMEASPLPARFPDAGRLDPVDLGHQRHRLLGQPGRIAVLERVAAEPRHRRLLGGGSLQLLLGDLALGDVVEDAVPDRGPLAVGLEHRLVEDPDDGALTGDHPVVDRRGAAVGHHLASLLLERPLAVVGMKPLRPEPRIGHPLLRAVAEDLLDLGTDIAPATPFAELAGVDDRRQALDQATVIVAGRRDLVEELGTPALRASPRPWNRPRVPCGPIGTVPGSLKPASIYTSRSSTGRRGRETVRTARRTPRPPRPWRGGRAGRGGRPASGRSDRRPGASRDRRGRTAPRHCTVQGPISGIASSRASAAGSPGDTRPAAISRATARRAIARPGERSIEASSAGARPAIVSAPGTSRSAPRSRPRRDPQRPTMRRWMTAARSVSISCLTTAQASASQAHGRRRGRSQGRRRSSGPSSGSRRKRR